MMLVHRGAEFHEEGCNRKQKSNAGPSRLRLLTWGFMRVLYLLGCLALITALATCSEDAPAAPNSGRGGTGGSGAGATGGGGGGDNVAGAGGAGGTGGSSASNGGSGGSGAVASGGSDGSAGAGGATGGAGGSQRSGACDSDDLATIVALRPTSARTIAAECAVTDCQGLEGDGDEYPVCVADCVRDAVENATGSILSLPCTVCYGLLAECSLPDGDCNADCRADACSRECLTCGDGCGSCTPYQECFNRFEQCTGAMGEDCFNPT